MKTLVTFLLLAISAGILAQSNPIANDDEFTVIAYYPATTFHFDCLENDLDPEGDELIIYELKPPKHGEAIICQDSLIRYTSPPYSLLGFDFLSYRIARKNDTTLQSDWAQVRIESSWDTANLIRCGNDYADAFGGILFSKNVLANDLNLSQNEIEIKGASCDYGILTFTDSVISFTPKMSHPDATDSILYSVKLKEEQYPYGYGYLIVEVENNHSYDSIKINNINAGVNSYGMLFSNCDSYDTPFGDYAPHFEVPKGSGKHSIFTSNLWIGGLHNGELHLAGERYRQVGTDFISGPVSYVFDSAYFRKWSRTWKLSSEEIAYHKAHYNTSGYEPIDAIKNWPGNGDPTIGQAERIAPFCDRNVNGIYEPYLGDYPLIRGDQAVFFVFNDISPHTETQGNIMGLEVRAMVYAFDRPEDSTLHNTIFVHYDVINRSANDYDSTYLGVFFDGDIGYTWDDFIGCNVEDGYIYSYNAIETDGYGNSSDYGDHPPAQSVSFLAGPLMDEDEIDNPTGQCDAGINGLNFGDQIVDNERLGMTGFMVYENTGGVTGDPMEAQHYYNGLRGIWKDDSPVIFGKNGYPSASAGVPARFMYPGTSDSCHWGTNGIQVTQDLWTEITAGNDPFDRRGLGTTGPFTFEAGERAKLDLAFIFARDHAGNNLDALEILQERNAYLRQKVEMGELIYIQECTPLVSTEENFDQDIPVVYPNPASDFITVKADRQELVPVKIYDLAGKIKYDERIMTNSERINIQFLESGFYFIRIDRGAQATTYKLIKM